MRPFQKIGLVEEVPWSVKNKPGNHITDILMSSLKLDCLT